MCLLLNPLNLTIIKFNFEVYDLLPSSGPSFSVRSVMMNVTCKEKTKDKSSLTKRNESISCLWWVYQVYGILQIQAVCVCVCVCVCDGAAT